MGLSISGTGRGWLVERRLLHGSVSLAAISLALISAATPAAAQDAAGVTTVEEMVVTGSRIARRDYTADSPIVTVGQETLEKSGSISLEANLNKLPQFTAGLTAYSSNFTASGQATLNLRGLGASRNLVLLDGRRLQPSSSAVTIDINTIPSALVESVEVISGGASAVYGSDAISGVVNFKLKRHLNGIEVNSQFSETSRGDGQQRTVSVAIGHDFSDDRGRVILGLEYYDREAFYSRNRPFYRASFAVGGGLSSSVLPQGLYAPTATNLPSQAVINSIFAPYGVAAGVVPRNAFFGANPDGTLFTENAGPQNYRGELGTNGMGVNAAGALTYDPGFIQALQSPMTRYAGFGRIDYDLTEDVTVYAQMLYTSYVNISNGAGSPAQGVQALNVPLTNPFIPAQLRVLLASRPTPLADFAINKRLAFQGERRISHNVDLFQFLVGATGKINQLGWTWDVSASHGKTDITDLVTNGAIARAELQALVSAPDGGRSLCEGGFNPFTDYGVSESCQAYLNRPLSSATSLEQDLAEANLQGKLYDLPAGELRFAVGADYRRNTYTYQPDSSLIGDTTDIIGFSGTPSTAGKTEVYEGYAELLVPVVKDLPLVRELNLDLAYRYSHYPQSGNTQTYMSNFDWRMIEGVGLRGGYQRAIRAPNVGELYQSAIHSTANYGSIASGGGDPCDTRSPFRRGANAAQVRDLCLAQGFPAAGIDIYTTNFNTATGLTAGNRDVKAETANTYTFGVVLRSPLEQPLLKEMTASIDYYDISVSNAIGTVSGPSALLKCFNSDGSNPTYSQDNAYCSAIERDPGGGSITTISSNYRNLGGYKTAGVDFQFDWRVRLGDLGAPDNFGALSLNLLANYLKDFKVQNLVTDPFQDYAGTTGSTGANGFVTSYPRWKTTATITYDNGPGTISLRWLRIAAMSDYTKVTNPSNERPGVSAYNTFDVFAAWRVNEILRIRAGVDNLADIGPRPIAGIPGTTDTGLYDPAGRRWYVAFSAKY